MSSGIDTAGRVVVGTDGSQRADRAVEWAAERAAARGLPLLVVLALAHKKVLDAVAGEGANARHVEELRAIVRQVEALPAALRVVNPGLDVSSVVVEGTPAAVLAEASKDAALVVVGARGQTAPLGVRLLGGVSDAVTAHCSGPVAVIGDDAHEHPEGPVMVGVDGSASSRAAVQLAFEAAELRGVPLVALFAFPYGAADVTWHAEPSRQNPYSEQHKQQLAQEVLEMMAEQIAAHPDVVVEVQVEWGRPQDMLVEASKSAGLLVVGSRGRGGFAGLLLGSTSKHVIRAAHCPVIVTRAADSE